MSNRIGKKLAGAVVLLLVAWPAWAQNEPAAGGSSGELSANQRLRLAEAYGRLPLSFEANHGQTDRRVKFLSRSGGQTLFLTSTEAVLTTDGRNTLQMGLLGASPHAQLTGRDELPGKSNYFLGSDPSNWHTDVPIFSKVHYSNVYPGVDLIFYGNQRELEYDFLLAPGADPNSIGLTFSGVKCGHLDHGDAVWESDDGEIRLRKPRLYQHVNGKQVEIAGGYILRDHTIRFAIGDYDSRLPLVIDPVLVYSTYLGGSGLDVAKGIAVDSSGNAFFAGYTASTNFPVSSTPFQSTNGGGNSNLFVAKLNAAGTALFYSTYVGGNGGDMANGLAVDSSGNAYVTGSTGSANFPVTPGAFQTAYAGGTDAFVTKLNATGDALVYSTYLGGSQSESATSIAVDASGSAYVTGETQSTNFPTTSGAFQTANPGGGHAFVTKLNAAGNALAYSTYLGGSGSEIAYGITINSPGNAYIIGQTSSTNFPGVNSGSVQAANGGGSSDGFVAEMNPAGSALVYATYLGGNGTDLGLGIALDALGNAYVTGYTSSTDFPVTAGALQTTNAGGIDGFVAKISPGGTALGYSTYLGGSGTDAAAGIAVDSSGNAYIVGATSSSNFPSMSSSSVQPANGGGTSDAFVAELNPTGSALVYSTYLGGSAADVASGIALDPSNNIYIAGYTASTNFPLGASPVQSTYGGGSFDAFVAKLSGTPGIGGTGGTATTTTTISSSATPSVFGQQVSFSITVTPSSASSLTPSGSITLNDGSTALGAVMLASGAAIFNSSNLALGNHSITAAYSGDSNFSASTSSSLAQVVNQGTTAVSVSASPNPGIQGQPVRLTATVTPVAPAAGTATGAVTFLDGTTSIGTGTLSGGQATLIISSLSVGSHSISCAYLGDVNFIGGSSAVVSLFLNPPPIVYSTNAISVGTGPVAAVINPVTHTLFVVNQGSNDVTAIDTRTNAILLSSIPVGTAPSAIGVNRILNQVYVANRDSANITLIDGSTYNTTFIPVATINKLTSPPSPLPFHPIAIAVNERTNQVFVGSTDCDFAVVQGASVTHPGNFLCGPLAMAVSPISGNTFVGENADSIIEQYEYLTDAQLKGPGFSTFIAPQALAINDPFVFAADADQGTGRVDVMNEVNGTNFQVILGGDPYAVAVNPVDGEIYLASQSPATGQVGTVTAVFVAGGFGSIDVVLPVGQTSVPATIPAPNKIAVDSTNDLVYVANEGSNNVTVIDGSALAVTTTVPVGTNPRAVLVNPDNCKAYVANFGSGTVSVVDPQISGPGICLSSNWLTFPAQLVNTNSAPQTVRLTNIGNAALLISSIVTSPGAFIESDDCSPVPPATTRSITPGGQCQIQAAFGPTVPGLVSGKILIADNTNGSPQTIVLTGNAVIQPTVNLTVDANPAVFGQSITLTANVSGSLGTPTGTVTFYNGQTVLGSVGLNNGTASISDTLFAIGSPTFTASYAGDLVYASGSSQPLTENVNKASTQFNIFISSLNSSNFGAPVTFESVVQIVPPGSGNATEPSGQVTFHDGQTILGSVTIQNGGANFTTSSLSVGTHSITATYPGDSNLLGSTSPVITQVVMAASNGGGGNGGGTGNTGLGISTTCGCAQSGNYVDPVPGVDPVPVPSLSTQGAGPSTSPGGYAVNASLTTDISGSQALSLQVTNSHGGVVKDFGTVVFSTNWGFSPDGNRFVLHSLTSGLDSIEVYDLTATPPNLIVNTSGVGGAQTSLSFSPSGRYFLVHQAIGQTSAEETIYQVQGVTSQQRVYDSGVYNFAAGSGSDYQTVSAGFGPGAPERAFVYAFLDPTAPNPNTFVWNLVSLFTGKVLTATILTNGNGSFWKFNPCGTVVGLATQTSSNQAGVDLYATSFVDPSAAHLPHAASGLPLNFILLANLALQEVQYTDSSGQTQVSVLTSDPSCLPNTPTGSNVVVSGGPIAGASQVSVTFANVTTPGVTAIAPLSPTNGPNGQCPPGPGGFQLAGNPPICFDLSTTAIYNQALNPAITVCVTITGSTSGLTFQHFQNGAYVNSTVTIPNETSSEICAGVQSLSPFAIFQRVPVPLTITANAISRQYGAVDPSFTVSYSGFVNGEGPSFLSGQLSCRSNDTSASPVGSYTIDCSSSTLSSPNYIITYATGVLTVTPASLTLTASNNGKAYGAALPTLTFGGSGFVNGDTSASLTTQPMLSTTATAASPVGAYAISIGGAVDANYAISYVPGTLTVTPAVVTITANNTTKVLNAVNAGFTWTATGFVNGDTASVLTANPSCTTAAGTNSPVGRYSINCSGASAANYTFAYVPGTLKIQYATAIGHVIQPPINADGTSVLKQGRTVPAKFSVYDADGVSIGTPGVVSNFYLTGIQSGTNTNTVEDVVDTNNPDTAFRWDSTNQQWIFNITTATLAAGSTYIYTITLNDGTAITFQYGLR